MFGKLFGKNKEAGGQIGPRPASNFGGGGGGGNQNSGSRTVEAIQKLGEVCEVFCTCMKHTIGCNYDGNITSTDMCLQTEELLMKRRTLLEKKCTQEAERAREQMKAKNKRGKRPTSWSQKILKDQLPCPGLAAFASR